MVSAACNAAHSLKERLARWLLMMRDQHDDDVLPNDRNHATVREEYMVERAVSIDQHLLAPALNVLEVRQELPKIPWRNGAHRRAWGL